MPEEPFCICHSILKQAMINEGKPPWSVGQLFSIPESLQCRTGMNYGSVEQWKNKKIE